MIQSVTLYADHPYGPLHVEFDPDKHVYTVNGERWPSVTSAGDALDLGKSVALEWWAANEYRDHLYLNWPVDPGTQQPRYVTPYEAVALIEEGRKAHAAKKQKAADVGTTVHDWVEAYIKSVLEFRDAPAMPENEQAQNSIRAYLEIEQGRRVHYLGVETIVASREHRYIGKLDASCVMAEVDGVLGIEDWKTANDMRLSYRPQLAAYAMAWNEEHPDRPAWRRQVNLLGKDDGRPTLIDLRYPNMSDEESTGVDFAAFRHLLWLNGTWGKLALAQMPKRKKSDYKPPVAWARGIA